MAAGERLNTPGEVNSSENKRFFDIRDISCVPEVSWTIQDAR